MLTEKKSGAFLLGQETLTKTLFNTRNIGVKHGLRLKKNPYALLAVVCVLLSTISYLSIVLVFDNGSASLDWPMYRHDSGHTG